MGAMPVARGKKDIQHWCLRSLFHIRKWFCPYFLFFCAGNDKTIAQYDPAIKAGCNVKYSENEWEHCCEDDMRVKEKGYYFICDGGYFLWKCLMSPVQHKSAGSDVDIWSKFVELV